MIQNEKFVGAEVDGSFPVSVQDQTTQALILPFAQVLAATTLAAEAVIGAYIIEVVSAVGAVVGQHFRIVDPISNRFYAGSVIAINGTDITLDSQIDFAYLSGSEVTFSNINMNVNGSVTPLSFTARTGFLSIPSEVDITRIIITCITDSPVTLPEFGDLEALTRGLAMRIVKTDVQNNIFNVKTNQDIISIAYDFGLFQAINPAQGVDGFSSRLTFAGQNKIGVVLRIKQNENIEILIQDDLTGITSLNIIFEGHVVQD